MARPVCKGDLHTDIYGLHQRIRSQGQALAKMDIRAFRFLIKASVSSTAFKTRISSRRFDRYAICFSPHADSFSGACDTAVVVDQTKTS
jgi:hypothetical protein